MILTSRLTFIFFIVGVVSILIFTIPSNFEMGSDYFDSHQYDKAFKYFSKTLKNDDTNVANLRRLKDYYLIKGKIDRAMVLQEKLVKLKPANISYWKDMENLYDWNQMPYEKLKAEEREAELVSAAQAKPLILEIAEGYRWLKKYNDANRMFSKLLKYDDPAVLDIALGYYTSTGQIEPAQKLLQRLSQKKKSDIYSRWLAELSEAEEEYLKANEFYREGMSALIKKPFKEDQLALLSPQEIEQIMPYLLRVNQNYRRLQLDKESEALNKQLIEALNYNTALSYDYAYLQLETKQSERAFESFKLLESREKDPERVFGICSIFATLLKAKEALRCLETLSQKYPSNTRYLEALAEEHSRQGNRKAALMIYEKILRIRGTREDASIWKMYRHFLLADVNGEDSREAKIKLPKKISPSEEIKNDQIREKMLVLHNDLGETDKSEKVLRALLKRHPRNIEYLKLLGWILINDKRTQEGHELFERILKIDPDDKDALIVSAEQQFQQGNADTAFTMLKRLPVGSRLAEIEFREEVYYSTKHFNEHQTLCLEQSEKHPVVEIRCLYRFGKEERAIKKAEALLIKDPSNALRSSLVGWYIEQQNVEKAEYHHEWLKSKRSKNNDDETQAQQLVELKEFLKQQHAWVLNASSQQVIMKGYQYNLSNIDVQKRLNGPGIGTVVEHLDTLKPFSLITPYISYLGQLGEVTLGPTLSQGEKKLQAPFTASASFFGMRNFFANLRFENSRPEYQLRDLQRENKAYKQVTSLYLNYSKPLSYQLETAVTSNHYTFDDQTGKDIQTFSEAMKANVGFKNFGIGARLFTAHLTSQDFDINRLHIQDAFAYYAVIQYANSFTENRYLQWNYLGKLAVGGDSKREINFGDSYNFRLQTEYLVNEQKGVRLYAEYYKESYLALISSMQIFGVNLFSYF